MYAWEVITCGIELQYCHTLELPRFFHTFRAKRQTPGLPADSILLGQGAVRVREKVRSPLSAS